MQSASGTARSELKSSASTAIQQRQMHREAKEKRRAVQRAQTQRAQLKAKGREGLLPHGKQLLAAVAQPAADALTELLAGYVEAPPVGRHYAAIPILERFGNPMEAVAIALRCLMDRITSTRTFLALAGEIGASLEHEYRAQQMVEKDRLTFLQMRKLRQRSKCRGRLLGKAGMRALNLHLEPWGERDRLQVGSLMLELVALNTGLVEIVKVQREGHPIREVQPLQAVIDLAAQARAIDPGPTRTPMLVPPRPWEGLNGGGHLGNTQPLVRAAGCRRLDLSPYERPAIDTALAAVNWLQAQELVINGRMIGHQRRAWELGIDGLFPVRREPRREPPPLPNDASREEWNRRNREVAQIRADLEANGRARMKIEAGLQALEELADQPGIWQAYQADHRGRIYTANRIATSQGPDHQKAAISFAHSFCCDVDGFEWLLMAAAGHWGMSRRPWAERLQWGKDNLERMVAAADDPINRAELWADAKDPWQFLQVADAVASWLRDPSTPIGVPIRLDQTTSGCGIIAALLRDERIGRFCNLLGEEPSDLYQHVADLVTGRLQMDLHTAEHRAIRAMAGFWLKDGVSRSLVKGPVLAVPYGGRRLSMDMTLAEEAHKRVGWVREDELAYRCSRPARYLARHLSEVIKVELASVTKIEGWARTVVDRVLKEQRPVAWASPSGWPVRQGERTPQKMKIDSVLMGATSYWGQTVPPDGELSARATRPSAAANMIHAFDAAFCHSISCRTAEQSWPLLTNHDCFATTAQHAGRLQQLLAEQMQTTYGTDQLARIKAEIEADTGLTMPEPPMVGTLDPALIGTSRYGFT